MAEQENKKSALEQLRELQETDTISSLDFKEPELQGFDASNIFEIDETPKQPEKKSFVFGKRANRHASQVKIKSTTFENEKPVVEDIMVSNGFKEEPVVEQPVVEEKPEVSMETSQTKVEDLFDFTQKPVSIKEEIEQENIQESMEEENVEEQEESTVEITEEQEESSIETAEEEIIEDQTQQAQIEEEIEEAESEIDEEELLYEKKKFFLSQYDKEELYLEQKSKEGYHFVRHVGKKFFFYEGAPKNYYYSVNYFAQEPSSQQWHEWESDGWKLVSRSPAKKKKEAGWFIFRNEELRGEYRKEIDNEEEKYRFFRKYSSSCRSTMFLIFICMALCAVTAFLQYQFKGYLWGFAICGCVFLVAFFVFCMYGRMLRRSKKTARMLKAKLRTKERRAAFYAENSFDTSETEEDLDTDWNTLEAEITESHKMERSKKRRA